MPIWTYRCRENHVSEVVDVWRTEEAPVVRCRVCGDEARRVMGAARFGGWREPKESAVSRAIRIVKQRGL